METCGVPVVGLAAPSGTGKTTLLLRLLPLLKNRGLRVGLIKKTHHDIELDRPGKDSYELRRAGAGPVVLSGPHRRIMVTDFGEPRDGDLADDLACFDRRVVDLVLVEGYRSAPIPKLELHRPSQGRPPLFPSDPHIVAVITDDPGMATGALPRLDLNRPDAIVDYLLNYLSSHAST
ncbi:MAG: molybdopterin-guanine dinucleotide biosynthesis protein B [Methylococcaceae bacterium]|nr:molybdopterin-guanine dinucleotide biosynthesis protein B [Methylococcaceae bacterium]